MAFLDGALRQGFINEAEVLVEQLRAVSLRIGVPDHVCVTAAIQRVRQEVPRERRADAASTPYNNTIAFREVAHWVGELRIAFDSAGCPPECVALLLHVAPAINYFGKRGGFAQYLGGDWKDSLDTAFTTPSPESSVSNSGQRTALDDFGPAATFAALNSFDSRPARRNADRIFVDTRVPLTATQTGPGFSQYSRTET
jgi:hypothetical protein